MSNDLGMDRSGNNNNWTVDNITYADQMLDSPTNNFCTWNPLENDDATLAQGNLQATFGSGERAICSSMHMSTGKWYGEFYYTSSTGSNTRMGIARSNLDGTNFNNLDSYDCYYASSGSVNFDGTGGTSGLATYTTGDIIGVALDITNGSIKFYKNNTHIHTVSSSLFTSNKWKFYVGFETTTTVIANFGQDSSFAGTKTAQGNQDGNNIGDFYYAPPSGYLALCTSNLPDVAVIPSEQFNPVLYTGDDGTQAITGVGFQPDFTWIKCRSHGGNDSFEHILTDAVRGVNKTLSSDKSTSETTNNATGYLSVFGTDGFTVTGGDAPNGVGRTYVAWNWKANGSGSSNTNGSINTTKTSANVDAGFSISTYTGTGSAATIGHGLSKAPEMYIIRQRNLSGNWWTYHKKLGATHSLRLDTDSTAYDDSVIFNDTAPTADVVSIGTYSDVNRNTGTFLCYAFHSVDGYSKVGSYTGNGNADGTFVYTGFRPAFVIVKRTDVAKQWKIEDNKRLGYNPKNYDLYADSTEVENSIEQIDFTSNGFKLRATATSCNASGGTYIYIAFAETPFKYSNAR